MRAFRLHCAVGNALTLHQRFCSPQVYFPSCVCRCMCVPAGALCMHQGVCLCIGVGVVWDGFQELIRPICDTLTYCPGKGTPGSDQWALGLRSSNALQTTATPPSCSYGREARGREAPRKCPISTSTGWLLSSSDTHSSLRLFSQERNHTQHCPHCSQEGYTNI